MAISSYGLAGHYTGIISTVDYTHKNKQTCIVSICILLHEHTHTHTHTNIHTYKRTQQTAASVAQEQAEADDDTTIQHRLLMGAGTTMNGASEMVDNDLAAG